MGRKSGNDGYCGTNSQWCYADSTDTCVAKCWIYNTAGNGNCPEQINAWSEDTWGKDNAGSWDSEANCLARKDGHDGYCGTDSSWCFAADSSECGTPPSESGLESGDTIYLK